jgi:hypothetical protein
MPKRGKSFLGALGILVVAVVLAIGLAWAAVSRGFGLFNRPTVKDPIQYQRDERKALEKMMEGDLETARQEGKSQEEINAIRARYMERIETLPKD